jgi:hypothetical protein
MNEFSGLEDTRGRIELSKQQNLNRAEWKVDDTRRSGLKVYREKVNKTPPNMPASRYNPPPGTQYDITKISKSKGMRCIQLETNQFSHKVPLDNVLMCLELTRPHDDPSQVMFPYGFTQGENFNVTNVIMPITTYENLSRELATNFENDMVYNQTLE